MLTEAQIEKAKRANPSHLDRYHEHNDCIRLAYEWLDAQSKLRAPRRAGARPLKHIIEQWAGRYVSQSDVEVAAILHPGLSGTYPYFNISARLVLPHDRRLDAIGEAMTQPKYRERMRETAYASEEG